MVLCLGYNVLVTLFLLLRIYTNIPSCCTDLRRDGERCYRDG